MFLCLFSIFSSFSQMKVFVVANDFIMISFVDGNTSENILFFFSEPKTYDRIKCYCNAQTNTNTTASNNDNCFVFLFFFCCGHVTWKKPRSQQPRERKRDERKKSKEKPLHLIVYEHIWTYCGHAHNAEIVLN